MTQAALPLVFDRYRFQASSNGFACWLEQWKSVDDVRVLVSETDAVVVPADAMLEVDARTGLYRL